MNEKEEENGARDGDEGKVKCKNEIENSKILLLSFFYSNACILFEFKRSMSLCFAYKNFTPLSIDSTLNKLLECILMRPGSIHCSTHRLQNKFYSRVSTFPYAHSL